MSNLTKRKTIYDVRSYSVIFFHETVNFHNLETAICVALLPKVQKSLT